MSETVEGSLDKAVSGVENEVGEPATVTMLQWNVWHKADPEEVINHLKQVCDEEKVDIVCLQELSEFFKNDSDVSLPQRIADALGMQFVVAPARHLDLRGKPYTTDDIGIFTRFPIESQQSQVLTENGWRVFSESAPSQNYLEVDVRIPGTDKSLTVANTHLLTPAFTRKKSRTTEVDELGKIISTKVNKPYVLTGDFNAGPKSYAAKKIAGTGLTSSREAGTPTWTSDKWAITKPWKRFRMQREYDQTFVSSSVKVASAKVLEDAGPSDHHPTITVMKF